MSPTVSQHLRYLDQNLQGCREQNALLASQTSLEHQGGTLPAPHQKIWGFSPEVGIATMKSIDTAIDDPLPDSVENETLELNNTEFFAHPDGYWLAQWAGCDLRILPNTSRADAIRMLVALEPIEKLLLSRGFPTRQTTIIRIGAEQRDYNIASASIDGANHLFFPKAPGTCHIMAVHTEAACQIPLEKIITHEIGHLLERFLDTNPIRDNILSRFGEIKPLLEKVSPHYLGGGWYQSLNRKTETLIQAQSQKLETILVNGMTKNTEDVITEQKSWFASEINAELIRYFLLEPLMGNSKPEEIHCSWPAMSQFIQTLIQESTRALNEPLFAGKRPSRKNPGQDHLEIPH